MDGIGIVEQGRRPEAGKVEDEPEEHDEGHAECVARRTG
jgi:hypothetical protein